MPDSKDYGNLSARGNRTAKCAVKISSALQILNNMFISNFAYIILNSLWILIVSIVK